MKFPAPPRPDLRYGPQGEREVDMLVGEVEEEAVEEMGVAAGAYWSGS